MSQRRPRRLALTAAALVVALASAGCTYLNPIQTHDFYQAADGMNATLGDVGVRNAIVVAEKSGKGQLYATLVNESDQDDASVTLEGSGKKGDVAFSRTIQVPAGSSVMIGPATDTEPGDAGKTQEVALTTVPVEAGDVMSLEISDGSSSTTITLPVTDQALDYYRVDSSDGGQG